LLDVGNVTLPGIQTDLDRLAAAVVAQVNALHQTGTTPGGLTGTDFFDPAGVTARSIALAAAVAASPAAIAAGATANAGDGAIALSLAGLRTTTIPALGGSAGEFYDGLVARIGSFTRDASEQARASSILVANADARRSSVSGVSIDEEMVTLIAQQQAYTAATRLVRVADEMLDDLLRMV
jgi:flagellar hook-associated protein 1 FlgK